MSARRYNYSEIDELNRILTVERELVLKTQENYRILKEKFLEISRENENLKIDRKKLLEGEESREKLQELETRSDELIKKMKQSNEEREVRYEKFKVDTIEELQNVYRKELQDQNQQIEKLREDRRDLIKENDELLEKIVGLNTEIDDFKRKEKGKEVDMRMKFDQKLRELVLSNDKRTSPRFEHMEQLIENLHLEIQRKEEIILEKNREYSTEISEKNLEIEELKRSENSLKFQIQHLDSTILNLNHQIQKINSESDQTSEINILKLKNDQFMKENLELELKFRHDEREFSRKLGQLELQFSVRISEFEKLCEQKDMEIEDLKSHLETSEKVQESLKMYERNLQIEEEHRERLEMEVKSLYEKLQKSGEEKEEFEKNLKLERDKLEISLVSMKKKLEMTPEAPENVEKLRKELRESERRRQSEKEKYQKIILELKDALKRLEKNYREAVGRLQETIPHF
ncbi:Protein CBG18445 [Caenorhabditis briggsae]|uniref:Protein CBG18445 n=1 Tax=Caenorhabditis briggsae TaxID=6238 RepID=A8XTB9_CAEBR|nr:Protein CBG18445 [Caenorhabditis briggsae]CAP35896.1 Protein CBG18445 [Caenorhabditis briggsae]